MAKKFSISEAQAALEPLRKILQPIRDLDDLLSAADAAVIEMNAAIEARKLAEKEAAEILSSVQVRENMASSLLENAEKEASRIVSAAQESADKAMALVATETKASRDSAKKYVDGLAKKAETLESSIQDLETKESSLLVDIETKQAQLDSLTEKLQVILDKFSA